MTMTTDDYLQQAKACFFPNYAQKPLVLTHGRGCRVFALDGREFIDLGTGISVTSLGHQHPALQAALLAQSARLWHVSNIYYNAPAIELAAELVQGCCSERVFFCNSGAEANEAAIKLARKYASRHLAPAQRDIVSFEGSFHGRTLATVTATAQPKYHEGFEPLPGGFRYCAFNDIDAIDAVLAAGTTCAVIVEPIQGEGGVLPAAPGFLAQLRACCDRHQVLLISDEIQCGMGRTGHFWAHAWAGIEPDIVTTAKALGGGLPIGAVLAKDRVAQVLQPGTHGTTFGGNPVACAVALAAVREIRRPELLANVRRQGEQLRQFLVDVGAQFELFAQVRGAGLMWGAVLQGPFANQAPRFLDACLAEGVLILQAGPNVLRFLPPLNIDDADLDEALARVHRGLAHAADAIRRG